tara:strand:- start:412 stop:567 length:156 start_codon:yes stop_codon:yes gene_type:complete
MDNLNDLIINKINKKNDIENEENKEQNIISDNNIIIVRKKKKYKQNDVFKK